MTLLQKGMHIKRCTMTMLWKSKYTIRATHNLMCFLIFIFKLLSKTLWLSHLYFMQFFSVDTTIFKKKCPLKLAYFSFGWAVFSTANWPKTSPNLKLCFI